MKDRLFISTVAKDAADTAIKYDIGVEIAIFCTAPNMDIHFEKVDKYVRNLLSNINRSTLHAPFNELYTASVDPLVIELAQKRYNRAYELASLYKSRSIIFHDSFIPDIYYPQWFVPESAKFWKEFINDKDDNINIHIENVLDNNPDVLIRLVDAISDDRISICLDIGHAFVRSHSNDEVIRWIEAMGDRLGHMHIHNNDGIKDLHDALGNGALDIKRILDKVLSINDKCTFTIESRQGEDSIRWLIDNKFL